MPNNQNKDITEVCEGCIMEIIGCFIKAHNINIQNCPCSTCLVKSMCKEDRKRIGCDDRLTHILERSRKMNNDEIYINLERSVKYLKREKL